MHKLIVIPDRQCPAGPVSNKAAARQARQPPGDPKWPELWERLRDDRCELHADKRYQADGQLEL